MYEHLVVFKFNDGLTPAKQQELLDQLLALRDRIPGITDLSAGVNVTEETDNIHGYTLGLRVTFKDLESLRSYGPHPIHQEFVKSLDGLLENVVVVDYPKI
ncbi:MULTISPECIES: Dabb family protein [Paenibacillus]|uniref:Stress responsive alpha-beta barrel domain-containing protein n=1 Tax=Paenibacillus sabinae T27 TaxID=1268072 RepID=X4ZJI9_9BACL|nr:MULTISPECIES: Dabb family protein [Paenibacillus]AHV97492.1 stress responsive alpha-beta barrel domain-containing protein [Paenibacillus sabinae T27]NJJ40847.1 Dabb family protein [Paenibacillus apii]